MIKLGPQRGQPIPCGSLILCQGCKIILMATKRELRIGHPLLSGHFESREAKVAHGMSIYCPRCGDYFFSQRERMYYIAPAKNLGARLFAFMWRMNG